MPTTKSDPVKVSFSFYPQDVETLTMQTVGLRRLGAAVRRGTVLRALIEITSDTEMFAAAVLLHRDYQSKEGPRESDYVADFPTVDLPSQLVKKLDAVVTELAAKDISANRAYVVRAILRSAPAPKEWVKTVEKFLRDNPRRPRTIKPKRSAK